MRISHIVNWSYVIGYSLLAGMNLVGRRWWRVGMDVFFVIFFVILENLTVAQARRSAVWKAEDMARMKNIRGSGPTLGSYN